MNVFFKKLPAAWAVFLLAVSSGWCAIGITAWVQRYNGSGNGDDEATAVAVDEGGNVFVTGHAFFAETGNDIVAIKFSPAGVPLWTNRYNGMASGNDYAVAIVPDRSGDLYVAGYSQGVGTGFDWVTIKYSNNGQALWTNRYNGANNGDDKALGLAVNGAGDVLVTGFCWGGGSSEDYVTLKYSSSGLAVWTNRYNGSGNGTDIATAVGVDSQGDVYVTGYSLGDGSGFDYVTIKYSSGGVALWTNRYNGAANGTDVANALAVDKADNVIVTGYSRGSALNDDYTTIKLSSLGVALWTNCYNGPANGNDYANAVAVDDGKNVIVTGYSRSGSGLWDYATIRYSDTGLAFWTNRYNGPANGNDVANAVVVDRAGNVFATGYSDGPGTASDFATIAYSGAGVPLWTNRYNGPAGSSDQPLTRRCMALAAPDAVVVVGRSQGVDSGSTNFDWVVVKYVSPARGQISKLAGTAWQLSFTGMPGLVYVTQFATNLSAGPWFDLSTNTADAAGFWTVTDLSATNKSRFYRAAPR